jgi:hypothetical protein
MAKISLAGRRGEATALDEQIKEHCHACPLCQGRRQCAERQEMAADLRAIREDIKTWFAPGPDQGELFS